MKKTLISVLTIIGLSAAAAFANVEMDINYYIAPVSVYDSIHNDTKTTYECPTYCGFDETFGFFLGQGTKLFDAGIGIASGLDVFRNPKLKSESSSVTTNGTGMDVFFQAGPVFRFTISKNHSFTAFPGLKWNMSFIWPDSYNNYNNNDKSALYSMALTTSLDFFTQLAYKCWFINSDNGGFHFGLNCGVQFDWLIAGTNYTITGTYNNKEMNYNSATAIGDAMKNGFNTKIFIGVCFNFGDRGYEKNSNND